MEELQFYHQSGLSCCDTFEHPLNVAIVIFLLEENVARDHRRLVHTPQHLHFVRRRVRDDEGIQADIRIAETLLDFLLPVDPLGVSSRGM